MREIREQYAAWKSECQKIVPVIGSGKFITTPIISDDGGPIEESSNPSFPSDVMREVPINDGDTDKKLIQWKLVLHQIGWYS